MNEAIEHPYCGINVGDEVTFTAAKIGKVIVGEVVEVIPPYEMPSDALMELIAGGSARSFTRCDHHRFAVRDNESGAIYIPYGKQSVARSVRDFRLETYTLDDVAVATKHQDADVRIGKRELARLQELVEQINTSMGEFGQLVERLSKRKSSKQRF